MGLLGGGASTSTSSMSRPSYLNNMINSLTGQINNAQVGDYNNMQYAGFNNDQNTAYQSLLGGGAVGNYANQVLQAGEEGYNQLNNTYNQINGLYQSGNITPDQIQNMASQLYNRGDVDEAINANAAQLKQQAATETTPAIAQQVNAFDGGSSAFGSGARLMKDRAMQGLTTNIQNQATQISSNAQQNAMDQAQNILTSNAANSRNALGALAQSQNNQADLMNTGANMAQSAYGNQLGALQSNMQNRQNELDNAYNNQNMSQNWQYNQINNQLNAANTLNGALGQRTTTTTTGGGSGMLGGAMSGAVAGSAFGPWGALAGATIGAAASS